MSIVFGDVKDADFVGHGLCGMNLFYIGLLSNGVLNLVKEDGNRNV